MKTNIYVNDENFVAGMTIKDKISDYDVELLQVTSEAANGVISEFATSEFSLTEVGTSIRFNTNG